MRGAPALLGGVTSLGKSFTWGEKNGLSGIPCKGASEASTPSKRIRRSNRWMTGQAISSGFIPEES